MAHLTLQEVMDRITKADSAIKAQRGKSIQLKDRPYQPEFYVPRVTRRLAHLTLGTLVK